MEISSFELGIEPIAGRDLGNAKLNAIFERLTKENRIVVQGYCLKLSNLEAFDRVFQLFLTIQTPMNPEEDRVIANYEVAGKKHQLHLYRRETGPTSQYESDRFSLPPKTTVALEFAPALDNAREWDMRGSASIEARDGISGTILLDPERREIFIADPFSPASFATPEQWSYGLGQRTAVL